MFVRSSAIRKRGSFWWQISISELVECVGKKARSFHGALASLRGRMRSGLQLSLTYNDLPHLHNIAFDRTTSNAILR